MLHVTQDAQDAVASSLERHFGAKYITQAEAKDLLQTNARSATPSAVHTVAELVAEAQSICALYLAANAPSEVNLSGELRSRIVTSVEKICVEAEVLSPSAAAVTSLGQHVSIAIDATGSKCKLPIVVRVRSKANTNSQGDEERSTTLHTTQHTGPRTESLVERLGRVFDDAQADVLRLLESNFEARFRQLWRSDSTTKDTKDAFSNTKA